MGNPLPLVFAVACMFLVSTNTPSKCSIIILFEVTQVQTITVMKLFSHDK